MVMRSVSDTYDPAAVTVGSIGQMGLTLISFPGWGEIAPNKGLIVSVDHYAYIFKGLI